MEKVNSGAVDFAEIDRLPLAEAREQLKTIVAFPKDVWVKRLMAQFYPGGLPECTLGIEGIAQQYLFDYVRNGGGLLVTND